jgi:hypothetical protein
VDSKGSGQSKELLVDTTEILGGCDPEVGHINVDEGGGS